MGEATFGSETRTERGFREFLDMLGLTPEEAANLSDEELKELFAEVCAGGPPDVSEGLLDAVRAFYEGEGPVSSPEGPGKSPFMKAVRRFFGGD